MERFLCQFADVVQVDQTSLSDRWRFWLESWLNGVFLQLYIPTYLHVPVVSRSSYPVSKPLFPPSCWSMLQSMHSVSPKCALFADVFDRLFLCVWIVASTVLLGFWCHRKRTPLSTSSGTPRTDMIVERANMWSFDCLVWVLWNVRGQWGHLLFCFLYNISFCANFFFSESAAFVSFCSSFYSADNFETKIWSEKGKKKKTTTRNCT